MPVPITRRNKATAATLAFVASTALLAGCSSMPSFLGGPSHKVTFTNVADVPLNVRFFVETPESAATTPGEFISDERFQVARGESTVYRLTRHPSYRADPDAVIHVHVEPVSPSWQTTGREYWLELLTLPPVTIVATGSEKNLAFDAGPGQVEIIPHREITKGRYEHQVVGVVEE